MTGNPSHKEVEHGETIEVDGKGKAISPPTKTRERHKLIAVDDDEEEPMSVEAKAKIYLAASIMIIILLAILFISWWCFGSAVIKAAFRKRKVPFEMTSPPAPTAAPSTTCTKVQEVLSYLGFFPC
jgi:hypothetical protein